LIKNKYQPTFSSSSLFSQMNLWQESGYLCLLIMDSLWLGLSYYLLANPVTSYWRVITVIGIGILISNYLSRYLNHRNLKIIHHRLIYLGWLGIYLLFCQWCLNSMHFWINPTPWMLLLGTDTLGDVHLVHFFRLLIPIIVIFRGLYIARHHLDPEFFQRNFKLGVVAVGLLGIYFSRSSLTGLVTTFALFLIIGLSGSIISRIYHINDQRGGKIPPPGWSRSVEYVSAVVLIVFTGIFLGWIVAFPLGPVSNRIIISIFSIIFIFVGILLSPILFAILMVFEQLAKLLSSQIILPFAVDAGNDLMNDYLNLFDAIIPKTSNVFDIIVVIFLGIILLASIWFILNRLRWQSRSSRMEMEEDISLLDNKVERHKKKRKAGWLNNLILARNFRKHYYANRIRAIYASFLSLCAIIGTPRNPAKTPNEFFNEIVPIFTGCGDEVELITSSYNRIRYGELPETEEEYQTVKDAWQVIKMHGNKIKKEKNTKIK
jgi:hypothetical protein